MTSLNSFPLFERIITHAQSAPASEAIVDVPHSLTITYSQLYADILSLGSTLRPLLSVPEARVVVLCEKGYLVALSMLSIWTVGGLSVKILPSLPLPEQSYMAINSDASLVICDANNKPRADELKADMEKEDIKAMVLEINLNGVRKAVYGKNGAEALSKMSELHGERRAMMLFISVTRHSALTAQVSAVVQFWRWTSSDNLLHTLPLNHLHGIVVALLPTIWAGATVELWEKFDGRGIWMRWINNEGKIPITMFFGVPTVYSRLIQSHSMLPKELRPIASEASSKLCLQVSGSAPLPESIKKTWERKEVLEADKYCVIASTGWENDKRVKGHVGYALPGTEIRLWNEELNQAITAFDTQGEIRVRGPSITTEYWRLPEATAKEFVDAGSSLVILVLGRKSTDIIKSGGEKISALEIERAILELPGMKDCAVVGVDDEEWGQIVSVCLVTSRPSVTVNGIRNELRSVLAPYKLPKLLKVYEGEIPRNNMGKVNKKKLALEAFPKWIVRYIRIRLQFILMHPY
ncbi:long-chain acyl-CoA synthetase [Cryptococcus neoformans D17-1]|nr:long-chain acyl-CoA synthetase [Cryptococcus neoformans var. grubii D17-1]